MKPFTPCLWFDGQAEEAARFYTSLVPGSKVGTITYYGDAGPGPKGSVLTVSFTLNGQEFMALNGGPDFKFSEAVSFMIKCESQAEIDRYWTALSADKAAEQCGWLKDKYGLSWQIVPAKLDLWMADRTKFDRVMAAVLKMHKLDLATLERVAAG